MTPQVSGGPYFYIELLGISPFTYGFTLTSYAFGAMAINMGSSSPVNTTYLFSGFLTGNSGTNFGNINGSLAGLSVNAATGGLSTTLSNTTVYAAGYPGNAKAGQYAEMLMFNRILAQSEYQQIEGYMAWKWGLQGNLPTTHPFKSNPPVGYPVSIPVPMTSAGFAPPQISGCALWLDAADRSSLTLSGTSVSQWRDKSGNNNNSTNASLVSYSTNSVNGLGAIDFGPGGINNGSIVSGSITPNYTGNQLTAFMVGSLKSDSYIYNRFVSLGQNGGNDYQTITNIQMFGRGEALNLGIFYNNTGVVASAIPGYDTVFLAQSSRDSSTLSLSVNGATPTTAASGTTGSFLINYYNIGASLTSQTGLSGKMCEVILYTGTLSTTQRQQVEGYLAWKWGLTGSLPNGHPYKTPPLFPFSYGVRNQVQRTWLPTQVSQCALWFDASDRSTILTSSGYVTQWNDKSGNNRNATNVGTGAISGVTSINGLNTIQFASGSNYLQTPSFTMDTITRTVFVVYKFTSNVYPTDGTYYLPTFMAGSLYPAGNGMSFQLVRGNGTPNYGWFARLGNNNGAAPLINSAFYTGASGPNNQSFILGIQRTTATTGFGSYTGTNVTGTLDTSIGYVATDSYAIGGSAFSFSGGIWGTNANGLSNSQIGELLYYNQAVSTGEFQQIEGYLAWKWGLQANLPITHPFKYAPPSPS